MRRGSVLHVSPFQVFPQGTSGTEALSEQQIPITGLGLHLTRLTFPLLETLDFGRFIVVHW